MSTIPYNPLQTVMPDKRMPAPDVSAENFGAGVGNALRQGSNVAAEHATKQIQLNNEADAKDADVQYQRELNRLGFDPEAGYFGKMGKGALDAYQSTQEDARSAKRTIADKMTSDGARRLFERAADAHLLNFEEGMSRHSLQQRKLWLLGASDARANETIALAAQWYNDDKRFNQAVATTKDEALQQAELSDEEPGGAQAQVRIRAYESKAWVLRISRMSQDNPVAAQDLFNANVAKLEPAQQVQLAATLKQIVIPVQTRQTVEAIMTGVSTPGKNILDALIGAESQGKDFAADGTPLTSPKGAKYKMQVMPDTAKDPGYGIVPAKEDTPAEYNRVGRDLLQAMLQRYGNQTMALAAYNWGAGRVDALAAKGIDPRRGLAAEQQFYAALPDETRDYVMKINEQAPATPGTLPTSSDIRKNYAAWQKQVDTAADAMYPNDPVFKDQLRAQLAARVATIEQGNNATEMAASEGLISAVLGLSKVGGATIQLSQSQRPKTLNDLLAMGGEVQGWWAASPPAQQKAILDLLHQTAANTNNTWTDQAQDVYERLSVLSFTDPEKFINTNFADPKLTAVIPHDGIQRLIAIRAATASRQERDLQKSITRSHAMSVLQTMVLQAGIDPTPKDGSADADKLARFQGRLFNAIEQFQAEKKATPSDKELREMGASLLSKGRQTDAVLPYMFGTPPRQFESPNIVYWQTDDPVPPDFMANMTKSLGRPPTDDEARRKFSDYLIWKGAGMPRKTDGR